VPDDYTFAEGCIAWGVVRGERDRVCDDITFGGYVSECKCDMRTKLVGDGCMTCNPEYWREMVETFTDDVEQFMYAAGQTTDEFNVRQTALYIGLQLEEMAEKLEAIHPFGLYVAKMKRMSSLFKEGDFDGDILTANREALLDADIDLAWVTVGAALSSGADVLGAMKEVARSNFSKMVDGKMQKDANGKVIKGPDFSPPNLAPFIQGDS